MTTVRRLHLEHIFYLHFSFSPPEIGSNCMRTFCVVDGSSWKPKWFDGNPKRVWGSSERL